MGRSLWMAAAAMVAGGCQDNLAERFFECRDIVAEGPTDASMECWTPESRTLIRGLLREEEGSSGRLDYLARYHRLLDFDDVSGEPEVRGEVALLTVASGRRKVVVILEKSEGQWRIDARELPGFWAPLNDALEAQ